MPRYTRCPYYIDENKKTISCEDVCRSFNSKNEKWAWMDMYCDSWDWMKCPYAADISEAYRRYEEGDVKALEKHEIEALKKEIESLLRKLGRANKRVERQQKKIDELRGVNKSLVTVNETLNKKNRRLHARWKELSDRMEKYEETIAGQVMGITAAYEARLAYLMDKYTGGILYEGDVNEWLKNKQFAIVYAEDDDEDYPRPCFKVIFKEVSEDGQKDQDIQVEQQQE